MVKITGPMFSLDASGSIGKTITFSKSKGRNYVRTLVKPSNPKSGGQVGVRQMFSFLSKQWASIPAADQSSWDALADQKVIAPFNAYMSFNQERWRNFLSPSQNVAVAAIDTPSTLGTGTAVAGVRQITVTQPITTAAGGWGIAFFRGLTTGFASSFSNLVKVLPLAAAADVVFVDTPLVADEYFYVMRAFTLDGILSAETAEVSATVT